jgi:hypothetical protein
VKNVMAKEAELRAQLPGEDFERLQALPNLVLGLMFAVLQAEGSSGVPAVHGRRARGEGAEDRRPRGREGSEGRREGAEGGREGERHDSAGVSGAARRPPRARTRAPGGAPCALA